ncbi:DUF2207 domain-containing protein, partial [Mycolicibacterium mageritense]|uniref:DUF2207 domain-containing protein n=1 Tax=Mycolicibacterium mageritense TaxID=53462 RepID=UPI0011DAE7D9
MLRVLVWSFTLALIPVGLLWPVVATGGTEADVVDDPVVITEYQADFTVDAAGQLAAVETITADFPSGRHGLFRYWDVANQNNPRVRQQPEIVSIELDGAPAPYQLQWAGDKRFRVAKIGDPYETLDYGSHVFEIRYTIPGVLDPGRIGADKQFAASTGEPDSVSAFYWNAIAPSWNNAIGRADISITLPAAVTGAECSVGFGVGEACEDLTVADNTVRLTATDLPPRTPVSVRAGVDIATPAQVTVPWPYTWDRILGRSLATVMWVAGLTVLLGAIAYLWSRSTVEPAPGFPLQYAPPEGLGPVQAEYIRTETVPKNGLTATLFHLAEHKLIELKQVNEKQWNVRGLAAPGAWADVDPVGVAVGSALKVMQPGAVFEAKHTVKSGQKLNKAKTDMTAAVQKWAFDGGLLVKRRRELWLRPANAFAFVAAISAFLLVFGISATMWGLPFAVYFVLSAGSWRDGIGTRRTAAGRELWSRVGGFHRILATDSAETRFDFAGRKDLYTAYIPYAVAAGAAAVWAKKYQDTVGAVAPQPGWYGTSSDGGWGLTGGSAGADFDSFESALSSSISAYTASQSSSSSSSGGGSSGGGGGG